MTTLVHVFLISSLCFNFRWQCINMCSYAVIRLKLCCNFSKKSSKAITFSSPFSLSRSLTFAPPLTHFLYTPPKIRCTHMQIFDLSHLHTDIAHPLVQKYADCKLSVVRYSSRDGHRDYITLQKKNPNTIGISSSSLVRRDA